MNPAQNNPRSRTSSTSTLKKPPQQIFQQPVRKQSRPSTSTLTTQNIRYPQQNLIQQIYPVDVSHAESMPLQLKQYILELQREYITLQHFIIKPIKILRNHIKVICLFIEFYYSLAINLDQKGVSWKQVYELMKNVKYRYEME